MHTLLQPAVTVFYQTIQLRCDGFGRNHRQMRAAECSVMEMAQVLVQGGALGWRAWWSIATR